MPESNLFDIQVVDEFKTTLAQPTAWLKSLPVAEQVSKIEHYLKDIQAEYDLAADGAERARIAMLIRAAENHLKTLNG